MPHARLVLIAAVALGCGLAVPHLLSDDVWAYAAYGALFAHGLDPAAHAWHAGDVARLHDGLLDAAIARWGSLPRDVYGPVFSAFSALIVAETRGAGTAAPVFALRASACIAYLACIALARGRLAPLLALQPVALWSAAEGHNDAFWLALVLAALRVQTTRARIATLITATAVKAVAAVPLALALAKLPRGARVRWGITAACITLAAYAPLLRSLAHPGPPSALPRLSFAAAALAARATHSWLPLAAAAAIALLAVAAMRRLGAIRAPGRLALAAWLFVPAPEPWYALWILPVAAVTAGAGGRALIAASLTGGFLYVQDAVGTAWDQPALIAAVMLAVYALPLLIALAGGPPIPAPQPVPAATAAPSASPSPAPAPTATSTASPQPSASPAFAYVIVPTPGPSGAPQIVEIAVSERTAHPGRVITVRIKTSSDVAHVVARTMGQQLELPQTASGLFGGSQEMPHWIPFWFLHRTYDIVVVASTADGRSASWSVPVRLER